METVVYRGGIKNTKNLTSFFTFVTADCDGEAGKLKKTHKTQVLNARALP